MLVIHNYGMCSIAPSPLAVRLVLVASLLLSSCRGGCGAGHADAGAMGDRGQGAADAGTEPAEGARPAMRAVEIAAQDGLVLVADHLPARGKGAPVAVLVAGPPREKGDWAGFTAALAGRMDVHVLAIDLRGCGKSTALAGETVDSRSFGKDDWEKVAADGPAVLAWIAASLGGDAAGGPAVPAIVFVGESLGATVAARWAVDARVRDIEVPAVVLISPGASMHGIDLWKPLSALDLGSVFVAAAQDGISWETASSVSGLMDHKPTSRLYPNTQDHGLALLHGKPGLVVDIMDFVEKRARSTLDEPM